MKMKVCCDMVCGEQGTSSPIYPASSLCFHFHFVKGLVVVMQLQAPARKAGAAKEKSGKYCCDQWEKD